MADPATFIPSGLRDRADKLVSRFTTRQFQPRLDAHCFMALPNEPSPAPRSRIDNDSHSVGLSNFGARLRKGSAKSKKRLTRPRELKNSATSAAGRSESKYSSCMVRRLKNMLLLYGIHDRCTRQSPSHPPLAADGTASGLVSPGGRPHWRHAEPGGCLTGQGFPSGGFPPRNGAR